MAERHPARALLPACHLLDECGVRPAELVDRECGASTLLARRLEARALEALACVPDYVDAVPVRHLRYRLFCLCRRSGPRLAASRAPRSSFPWVRPSKAARADCGERGCFAAHGRHGAQLRRQCAAAAAERPTRR